MRQKTLKLGIISVFGVLGVWSCSAREVPGEHATSSADGARGDIQLGLLPVSGVTLSSIHYVVTNSANPPAIVGEGELPSAGAGDEISLGVSLPIGTGYRLSLSAAPAEQNTKITCGAAAGPFDVLPNSTSSFRLVLSCQDTTSGDGAPAAQVQTDACPRLALDFVLADPSSGGVGSPVMHLRAAARDLDGKAVSYAWKLSNPAVGTFSSPTAAESILTCTSPASNLLAGVTVSNGDCSKALAIPVQCSADLGGCGNGQIDPGETCDTGIPGSKCPSDCTYICGDGVAEAPAEECDPGNTDNCSATCQFRKPLCGDGFLTTVGPNPEFCDGAKVPPNMPADQVCNATCDRFVTVVCGDGVVNGTEQCDDAVPPFPDGPSSPSCSNTCKKVSTPACVACENAGDCFESVNNCEGVSGPFSVADQSKCYDVMSCIQASNCFDGTGTLGKCYCGSLGLSACGSAPFTGPGSPDGACVAQIRVGFSLFTTNQQVLGGLSATNFPSGAAMSRLSCQKGANQAACLGVCGFTAGGPAFP